MISKTLKTLKLIKEKSAIYAEGLYHSIFLFFFKEIDLPSFKNKRTYIKPDLFLSVWCSLLFYALS